MLHPIFIKTSLRQFPGSQVAFWEQVSLTVETLLKDGSLHITDTVVNGFTTPVVNGFTTPVMETFPVTPVRPVFDFASTCYGQGSILPNSLQQEIRPEECVIVPECISRSLNSERQYVSRGTSTQSEPSRENLGTFANERRTSHADVSWRSSALHQLTDPSSNLGCDRDTSAGTHVSSTPTSGEGDYVDSSTATGTHDLSGRHAPNANKIGSSVSYSPSPFSSPFSWGNNEMPESDTQEQGESESERDDGEFEGCVQAVSPVPSTNNKRSAPDAGERERSHKRKKTDHKDQISSAQVAAEFRLMKLKIEDVSIVTSLVNKVGTLESIQELRDACSAARGTQNCFVRDNSVDSSAMAIVELEDQGLRSPSLLRYHWLKVIQWRDEQEKKHKCDGWADQCAARLALTDLMGKMRPRLQPGQKMYKTKYKELGQMCSYSRQWLELEREFSIGILAVIPSADLLDLAHETTA